MNSPIMYIRLLLILLRTFDIASDVDVTGSLTSQRVDVIKCHFIRVPYYTAQFIAGKNSATLTRSYSYRIYHRGQPTANIGKRNSMNQSDQISCLGQSDSERRNSCLTQQNFRALTSRLPFTVHRLVDILVELKLRAVRFHNTVANPNITTL